MKFMPLVFCFLIILASCSSQVKQAPKAYPTKESCESTEKCVCDFATCDYLPGDKTFDEVCGKGFKKGWQCVSP